MERPLEILDIGLLEGYCEQVTEHSLNRYNELEDSELSVDAFSFYTSVAAVFSSKIEGENIELDSYVKHKKFGIKFLPDYTQKTDDLYNAYQFAKANLCTKTNIQEAHKIISKHILPVNKQGKERMDNMYVTTDDGRIEYVAALPDSVRGEMNKFYADLNLLVASELKLQEVFYYASLLHLIFVKIHPFDDGNGRTARLIEKWFLAEKLGPKAWLIQSEKNYYRGHQAYYKNIRVLGLEYQELDYTKALPFLEMLPESLIIDKE